MLPSLDALLRQMGTEDWYPNAEFSSHRDEYLDAYYVRCQLGRAYGQAVIGRQAIAASCGDTKAIVKLIDRAMNEAYDLAYAEAHGEHFENS